MQLRASLRLQLVGVGESRHRVGQQLDGRAIVSRGLDGALGRIPWHADDGIDAERAAAIADRPREVAAADRHNALAPRLAKLQHLDEGAARFEGAAALPHLQLELRPEAQLRAE